MCSMGVRVIGRGGKVAAAGGAPAAAGAHVAAQVKGSGSWDKVVASIPWRQENFAPLACSPLFGVHLRLLSPSRLALG